MAAFFYTAWLAREIYCRFLVNKHGDLYFLLQNFDVQIVLFELDNFKKKFIGEKKKIQQNACTKSLLEDANYDLENNDPRKVLIRCCLDLFEFFHKIYIALFLMLGTFYLSSYFLSITLKNFASSYQKM